MIYDLRKKSDDRLMRLIGFFWPAFMVQYTTTYRLPFMELARVCVPSSWDHLPLEVQTETLAHEEHHVRQFAPWYGPWWIILAQVLPLPVLFSGRWLVERRAVLDDIRNRALELEQAIGMLWHGYGWCWPRTWMRSWFLTRLNQADTVESPPS